MQLTHGLHLAYCTNIHRGESWAETFANLRQHTLAVQARVGDGKPFGIGLRLSAQAAREVAEPAALTEFRRWLEAHDCYVFTLNGFPYGRFHGGRVKEQVYRPDWTSTERLDYTKQLFEVLAQLAPPGAEGSVSTSPGSFKAFIRDASQEAAMRENLWRCVEHVAALSERSQRRLHLGLEPEPLGFLETSAETAEFFARLRDEHPHDPRLEAHLGVTYDACHLAVEFERPADVLARFARERIRLSKVHLSSALKVRPTTAVRAVLAAFADDTYLHQVVARAPDGSLTRYRDLPDALAQAALAAADLQTEWRIHFHIPLHSRPRTYFDPTAERRQTDFLAALEQCQFDATTDHLCELLDILADRPELCAHLEMETYTWEVLPPELKNRNVEDQLAAEYDWTLEQLAARGIRPMG